LRIAAVKQTIEAAQPAYQRVIGDPGSDLHGFVVIDSFVSGRGTGGIRCTASVTLDEVARLAREMTYKFAFLHLPSGGAKAGLVAPAGISDAAREQLFRHFGEAIGDLIRNGTYVGGLDMGTGPEDIHALNAGAGIQPQPGESGPDIDSNYYTALTVLATLEALLESRGRTLRGTSVLVEGVGKVGSHLLRLLGDAGARVVGVSTLDGAIYDPDGLDVDDVCAARSRHGDGFVSTYPADTRLPSEDLFVQAADVLIPGGGADSLNADNVDAIKARWIVPVANICATRDIEAALHRRNVEFIPGFVSNSGGVFCWYLGGLSKEARDNIIRDRFKARVMRLVEQADRSGQSLPDLARDIALQNLSAMQRLDNGGFAARADALLHKLSPMRLGYVLGCRVFGRRWGRDANFLVRNYYDARYFR
jgi:glutamate dehydrogenase (NAD(P)+)